MDNVRGVTVHVWCYSSPHWRETLPTNHSQIEMNTPCFQNSQEAKDWGSQRPLCLWNSDRPKAGWATSKAPFSSQRVSFSRRPRAQSQSPQRVLHSQILPKSVEAKVPGTAMTAESQAGSPSLLTSHSILCPLHLPLISNQAHLLSSKQQEYLNFLSFFFFFWEHFFFLIEQTSGGIPKSKSLDTRT